MAVPCFVRLKLFIDGFDGCSYGRQWILHDAPKLWFEEIAIRV